MLRNVKQYERPTEIEDAVALVQSNTHAAYLGGGAWTVAQGDPSLEVVVDLQDLNLDYVDTTLEEIRIGAMASLQEVIDHPDAGSFAGGFLARAASYVQSRSLREQGSVGGALMVAGPADPLTTALLVLDAEVRYADPTMHTAPFMSFVAYRDRLTQTRVLLTEVRVKREGGSTGDVLEVLGRSPKDHPIVCAAAHLKVEEGLSTVVRLAVGGVADRPVRLHKAEHVLRGQLLSQDRVETALKPSVAELEPPSDYLGSAEYRLAMATVLARRAVLGAWRKARQA
ncbi:MAG: FAD binding domain-containing protein [Anaerolineae bacterium]